MEALALPDGVQDHCVLRVPFDVGVVVRLRACSGEAVAAAGLVVGVLRPVRVRAGNVAGGHQDACFPAGLHNGADLQLIGPRVVSEASGVGHLAQVVPGDLVQHVHGVCGPVHVDRGRAAAAAWAHPPAVV